MNWPICSLNFVPVGAMRQDPESPMKRAVIISHLRQSDTRRDLFIGAQIAAGNFRASGRYAVRLRAWPAVARTMEVNSTRGFD